MIPFVVAGHTLDYDALQLQELKGFAKDFLLARWVGHVLTSSFPKSVTYTIDGTPVPSPGPQREDRRSLAASMGLSDSLRNNDSLLVVSQALRSIIEAHEKHVELLRVTLVAPKKKKVDAAYFIVNPLDAVDALDIGASTLRWNHGGQSPRLKDGVIDDSVERIERIVLDEKRVPADRSLFLLKYVDFVIFMRTSLLTAIGAAGLTGIEPIQIKDYPPA